MSSCTKCGYPVGNHPFRHPFAPVVAEAPKPPAPESPYVPLVCGVGEVEALRAENARLESEAKAALRHAKELRRVFEFTLDLSGPRDVRDVRIHPHMKASAEEACRNFDAYLAKQDKDRAAVAAERERCAKVVETYSNSERATDLILAEIRNPKGAR